jgi:CubicO group peptidase (beta-lactamase class C family)
MKRLSRAVAFSVVATLVSLLLAPAAAAPPPSAHPVKAEDIEAFLDGLMPQQLGREDIAGAVISIVKDGKVIFAKGYGYADAASKTPVSPDNTLFRPGSISKLFTWTSVMQLVESGKLDLDRDVNQYIDFNIPARFGKPLTLRDIMTHTSGFEETAKELFVPDQTFLTPLKDYLATHLPKQIFAPGAMPAYSNYATALAGRMVERASGETFDDYVEAHIFRPLGMTHSSFRQPLPSSLQPLMSSGYSLGSGKAEPYEFVLAAPAGSSAVSAMDMTRFMMAHLQNGEYVGEYQGVRILKPETARLMHTRQRGLSDALPGMALGFYEETRNGHRIIGHGGDTAYFHSDLHLVPDQNLGFFVSYNSAGKGQISARGELWHAFLDRYYPYTTPAGATPSTAAQDAKLVAGSYVSSRRPETTIVSLLGVAGQVKVMLNGDGTISADFSRDVRGQVRKWREVGPLIYQDVDSQEQIAFIRDPNAGGRLTLVPSFPVFAFQRVEGTETQLFSYLMIGFSLGVFLLSLLLWPVAAVVRWHYAVTLPLPRPNMMTAARVIGAFALASVVMVAVIVSASSDPGAMNHTIDWQWRLMQLFAGLAVIGTIVAAYNAFSILRAKVWWGTKVHAVALALAFLCFAWFVLRWHLLNPSLNY